MSNSQQPVQQPDLTIVTPIFNERDNLDALYTELTEALDAVDDLRWEWLAVDDHSTDESTAWLRQKAADDPRVRFIRFAANRGSHMAIAAGLLEARGGCAVVMAADLQDPPACIGTMLDHWRAGQQVVWMVRAYEAGEERSAGFFPRLWYRIVSGLPGIDDFPKTGSDCFLVDRDVIEALRRQNLHRVAIPILIRTLGFRQINVDYRKRDRLHGHSKWTLRRKISHVYYTVLSFTPFPLRALSLAAALVAALGFLGSLGWAIFSGGGGGQRTLGVLLALLFLTLSFAMGAVTMLSDYLWRTFEYSRKAPDFLIEETSPPPKVGGDSAREGTPP